MALDSIVRGVVTGTGAEVNANNELKVALPSALSDAGYAKMIAGDGNPTSTTEDGYLNTSTDSLTFFEQVDGAAVNINTWDQRIVTMTIDQPSGYIRLNASALTTINTSAQISSVKQIPLYGTKPSKLSINAKVNVAAQTNATIEMGFGVVSGVAAPTDGIFFRWAPSGSLFGVMNNTGTETLTAALTQPPLNDAALYEIVVVEDLVQFFIDDALVATIPNPIGNAFPVNAGHQPIFARVFNAAVAPAIAPILQIGQVICVQQSINQNKLWKETLGALGRGSHQSPVTAFAQTANFANNTAPVSIALANAGPGYTTLGGKWQFAAIAGAETDLVLFGYQVPAGIQLSVVSIAISAMNTVVAVAGTATVLEWGVAVNASAVSLATADGAGTWAPRRLALGRQVFPIGAAVAAVVPDLVRTFDPPLPVDSGRFFHVILRMPIATATATEIFRGECLITGYFE